MRLSDACALVPLDDIHCEVTMIEVKEKKKLETLPKVTKAIESAVKTLGEKGRVLVRYSGTENLARVLVEGEREEQIAQLAGDIAGELTAAIGE